MAIWHGGELRIENCGRLRFIDGARMKKYWHVIGFGIQNNLTCRFNYMTRTLFSFIPLFAMLSLWRTIYASKGQGECARRCIVSSR